MNKLDVIFLFNYIVCSYISIILIISSMTGIIMHEYLIIGIIVEIVFLLPSFLIFLFVIKSKEVEE